jgi:phytoene dehydrogenase-like protein
VVVGGGHNGLVAAAYLARAGRSVCVLERAGLLGGAAVSTRPFPGVDARLSSYSYLVSLLPRKIVEDLGLRFAIRRRRISSYTPTSRAGRDSGLLVDAAEPARTADSLRALTGDDRDIEAWRAWDARCAALARTVFPTLTEPLRARDAIEAAIGDENAWRDIVERPLGEALEATFDDDLVRGVVLTDALIGTFADAHSPSLIQNRCFLYHVIGGGTGDWDVPIGGMGALTDALAQAAAGAGAELVTGAEVVRVSTDGERAEVELRAGGETAVVDAKDVLANVAPAVLAGLLGDSDTDPRPEGAQLKINMVLSRLPRLRDNSVDPRDAFAGTFHVAEGYAALQAAHAQAASGRMPDAPPCEIYCHSLTDPSILGPDLQQQGAHTLTLFGLHMPARLFTHDPEQAKQEAVARTLQTLNDHLAEPIEDCLLIDADGAPCLEAKSPVDLEASLNLPAGHIFHHDLSWPWAETADQVGTWGVETARGNVFFAGAGARRGGGVSGIPGHNAARAVLDRG